MHALNERFSSGSGPWHTLEQVAQRFQIPERVILELIATRELEAVRFGAETRIADAALAAYCRKSSTKRRPVLRRMVALFALLGTLGATATGVLYAKSADEAGSFVIPYQGYLEHDGTPVEGRRYLTFRLYRAASGGEAIWSEAHAVGLTSGRFTANLGATNPLDDVLRDEGSLYVEISVDEDDAGEAEGTPVTLGQRQLLGSAPFARRAAPGADFAVDGDIQLAGALTDPAGVPLTVPAGAVVPFSLDACPAGWSPYLPARGRTVIGVGGLSASVLGSTPQTEQADTLGGLGGEDRHVLTVAEMPSHNHQLATVPSWDAGGGYSGGGWYGDPTLLTTSDAGGNEPHNNMPPFVALLYCVKN